METIKVIFNTGATTCIEMEKEDAIRFMNSLENKDSEFKTKRLFVKMNPIDCAEVLKKL